MILEITNLDKTYTKKKVLSNINLKINKGEIVGLIGPNGAGKTTLISCITNLVNYEGEIILFGDKTFNKTTKLKIGYVTQQPAYFDTLNLLDNILYFALLNNLKVKNVKNRAIDLLKEFGLYEHRKKFPAKLSGGMLKKLNFICAIIHEPEFIICDEPTAALDPQSRNFMINYLQKLNANGTSILYTTHYLDEIETIANRIILMDDSKIIIDENKQDLIDEYLHKNKKIVLKYKEEIDLDKLLSHPQISYVRKEHDIYYIDVSNDFEISEFISHFPNIDTISYETLSLNELFLNLTGKELRDE